MSLIRKQDFITSICDALQYISYYHAPDFLHALQAAWESEQSPAARDALGQILTNSFLCAEGKRPLCQDTGIVIAFVKVGMQVRWDADCSLQELVDEGVRLAWSLPDNPLRASIVCDPAGNRRNTGDNTPAVVHVELVPGDTVAVTIAAKGGGSENKAQLAMLEPSDDIVEWVLATVPRMGAGWCPPGVLGIGIGGTAEKAMLLAKLSLMAPIDIQQLKARGPASRAEELRLELYDRINALGIGAQGLGGLTTVLDVKILDCPTHATSLPVALIPNCAATRHVHFTLDGNGPAVLPVPKPEDWPQVALDGDVTARRVNLDHLDHEQIAHWQPGEKLLISGKLLTGRDAAHKRLFDMHTRGEALPPGVDFSNRFLYYVGPVKPVHDEVIGPAGPTTAARMDRYTEFMLEQTGLLGMIGKGERGEAAIESIKRHRAVYLIGVGGAAYLISRAIREARVIAFADLGMEAIYQFVVEDMPVMVAVDVRGNSIHRSGPEEWRTKIGGIPVVSA